MKSPSKKAGLLWLVVLGVVVWWLLSSSDASAADVVDERPLYGPPTPPREVSGEVDFEDPIVVASDPNYQAGAGGYYSHREDYEDE